MGMYGNGNGNGNGNVWSCMVMYGNVWYYGNGNGNVW